MNILVSTVNAKITLNMIFTIVVNGVLINIIDS